MSRMEMWTEFWSISKIILMIMGARMLGIKTTICTNGVVCILGQRLLIAGWVFHARMLLHTVSLLVRLRYGSVVTMQVLF